MKTQYRTIEERLEHIELAVQEVKSLVLKLGVPKAVPAERLTEEFMNVKELAKFAKVETSVIYSACAKRELKFIKLGKLYKFRKEDVLEWLNANHSRNGVDVDDYVDKYLQKNLLKG
ncbi:MAG TPA: helix-turn-helix domain-containing protein [Puia sp.]